MLRRPGAEWLLLSHSVTMACTGVSASTPSSPKRVSLSCQSIRGDRGTTGHHACHTSAHLTSPPLSFQTLLLLNCLTFYPLRFARATPCLPASVLFSAVVQDTPCTLLFLFLSYVEPFPSCLESGVRSSEDRQVIF